eukprot:17166-Heterococcus_DN1.PRE.2
MIKLVACCAVVVAAAEDQPLMLSRSSLRYYGTVCYQRPHACDDICSNTNTVCELLLLLSHLYSILEGQHHMKTDSTIRV